VRDHRETIHSPAQELREAGKCCLAILAERMFSLIESAGTMCKAELVASVGKGDPVFKGVDMRTICKLLPLLLPAKRWKPEIGSCTATHYNRADLQPG